MRCRVLLCVVVCCCVLLCVAVCCFAWLCVVVCCGMLLSVVVLLWFVDVFRGVSMLRFFTPARCSIFLLFRNKRCWLFVVCGALLVIRWASFVISCLLSEVYSVLLVVVVGCGLLIVVCCLVFVVCGLPFVVRCLVRVVCRVLIVACCCCL